MSLGSLPLRFSRRLGLWVTPNIRRVIVVSDADAVRKILCELPSRAYVAEAPLPEANGVLVIEPKRVEAMVFFVKERGWIYIVSARRFKLKLGRDPYIVQVPARIIDREQLLVLLGLGL